MFFIIWGWRGRESEAGRGRFHCPQCETEQPYRLMSVATWFTLYFIPLFVTERHGEYVGCKRCGGKFIKDVLDLKLPTTADRLIESIRADLGNGTPVEMARTKLENDGLGTDAAEELVAAAVGKSDLRHCSPCNLGYLATTQRCSACGTALGTGGKPRRVMGRLIEE